MHYLPAVIYHSIGSQNFVAGSVILLHQSFRIVGLSHGMTVGLDASVVPLYTEVFTVFHMA
jgi:hypothetical protein